MKIRMTQDAMAPEFAAQLAPQEAQDVLHLGARKDTFTLTFSDGETLVGYVVFSGHDDTGYFVIYAARAIKAGLGSMVLAGFLGATAVTGKPLRVHFEKVAALGRMAGTDFVGMARDMAGVQMAVLK